MWSTSRAGCGRSTTTFHGDPSHDESGFRFERHAFVPGEYVSIKEQDDVMRTFRVVSVRELD